MSVGRIEFEKRSFEKVHSILTSQGFTKIGFGHSIKYRAAIRDSSAESTYWLEIPVSRHPQEAAHAKLGQPSLYGEKRFVPKSIHRAAESKLLEIADYMKTKIGKREIDNSLMAQTKKEIKRLGKEMEAMKTNKELHQHGWIPDPTQ
jgi:hypothetical protein